MLQPKWFQNHHYFCVKGIDVQGLLFTLFQTFGLENSQSVKPGVYKWDWLPW